MELRKTQSEVKELLKNIQHPRIGAVLGLYEEVGEFAKVMMNWEIYGEKDSDNMREECADIFFSLIDVCNAYNVDLQSACESKLENTRSKVNKWEEKYSDRLRVLRDTLDVNE